MRYRVTELLTHDQMEDLVALGRLFIMESGPHLDYDEEEVRKTCKMVIKDIEREYVNIFLVYREHELIGFLYCSCGKYLFNKQRYAQQELIFIRPAYRGTRAFLKLIKAFEEWARLRSAMEIWMGNAHNKYFSAVLPKIGYPEVGTYHRKRTV
jgi:GNAT superfamily N-acetyltransferase